LSEHRDNPKILKYREFGLLYVTWAKVSSHEMSGVEAYLANLLKPLEGERYPNVPFISVNSPFEQ